MYSTTHYVLCLCVVFIVVLILFHLQTMAIYIYIYIYDYIRFYESRQKSPLLILTISSLETCCDVLCITVHLKMKLHFIISVSLKPD